MIPPPKPAKPPKPYAVVSSDSISPFSYTDYCLASQNQTSSTNPFDDNYEDSTTEDSLIMSSSNSSSNKNPFGDSPSRGATKSKGHSSTKKPALNSFDSVHIVANPSTKKKSNKTKSSHDTGANRQRTSEGRADFLRKIKNMDSKLARRSIKDGTGSDVVCVDSADDNAVIRFLLSDRGVLSSVYLTLKHIIKLFFLITQCTAILAAAGVF